MSEPRELTKRQHAVLDRLQRALHAAANPEPADPSWVGKMGNLDD